MGPHVWTSIYVLHSCSLAYNTNTNARQFIHICSINNLNTSCYLVRFQRMCQHLQQSVISDFSLDCIVI